MKEIKQRDATLWGINKDEIIPIKIGALRMISKRLETWIREINVNARTDTL